jgi:periplasmic protein TonB
MFTTLVESRSIRARSAKSTLMSVILHGAVLAAAVAMTTPAIVDARPKPKSEPIRFIRTVEPTPPPTPIHEQRQTSSSRELLPTIAMPTVMPTTLPPIDASVPETPPEQIIIGRPGALTSPYALRPAGSFGSGTIVDEALVDRIPRVLGIPPTPRYPNALREIGVAGQVTVRFVVDTLGRAEMDGVTVVESSHILFADAVKSALTSYRFSPGEVAGRKVRTMVQVPFTFALTR